MDDDLAYLEAAVKGELETGNRFVPYRSRASSEEIESLQSEEYVSPSFKSQEGTREIYKKLQERIEDDAFLNQLKTAKDSAGHTASTLTPAAVKERDIIASKGSPSPAVPKSVNGDCPSEPPASSTTEERSQVEWEIVQEDGYMTSCDSDFEIVSHDDLIDAIAAYVARVVVLHPASQNLTPAQLQVALCTAMTDLQKGPIRKLIEYCKVAYCGASWTYGVCTMYTAPWLVKLVISAIFTHSRLFLTAIL
ncbi:hypothetical protein CYMTET_54705 [Cymbomonas tetramitiformis]|uniref:Uncharacterized protein n=1 Tax=Cymbomonas tetramitiformis TaxID=36881 RepID=A0AAE0EP35_9CHLO|nr:hypothetical protein CYMTET_54705 [Cymbomonas tetramitiformis]